MEDKHADIDSLRESWTGLHHEARLELFQQLPRPDAEELFLHFSPVQQAELLSSFPWAEKRSWVRLLAPDDAADLIQEYPPEERDRLLRLLDDDTRKDVLALLAYAEDEAGGLMNPRFVRLRPEVTV